MASLNWAHLSPTSTPVPLPREKLVLSLPGITVQLLPTSSSSSSRSAQGTVYLSSQRVVFVAANLPPRSTPTADTSAATRNASSSSSSDVTSSAPPPEASTTTATLSRLFGAVTSAVTSGSTSTGPKIESLSIPIRQFQKSGRLIQPFIAATYYEITVSPADGGGLESDYIVRFSFHEAGGFQFFEAIESIKVRLAHTAFPRDRTAVEPLPLYQAPADANNLPSAPAVDGTPTTAPASFPAAQASTPPALVPPIGEDETPPGYAP